MTTDTKRPTARQVAGRAWKSTFAALVQMAPLFLSCFALLLAISVAGYWLGHAAIKMTPEEEAWLKPGSPPPFFWRGLPATIFWTILGCIIMAPVAVAVHRFVLLGEVRKGVLFVSPVTLRFAALVAVFAVLQNVLGVFQVMLPPLARMILNVAYWSCAMWTLLIFPSIAIEEPFGSFASQLDTAIGRVKGNFWLIVRTMLMTVFLIFVILAVYLIWPIFKNPQLGGDPNALMAHYLNWTFLVITAAEMILMTALGAAAASWLYSYATSRNPPASERQAEGA